MLHDDFLELARRLAETDARRPRAINLRRATSAAYYAVFHRLINDAVRTLLGSGAAVSTTNPNSPQVLRIDQVASRWFNHRQMKTVSGWFDKPHTAPKTVKKLLEIGQDSFVPAELRGIAGQFVTLQTQRHAADYDPGLKLTRTEVRQVVQQAEDVFGLCDRLAGHPMYRLYQLLLLAGNGIVTDRD